MRQLISTRVAEFASSLLPVLREEQYPKLPDSRQVSMERELGSDNMAYPHASFISNNEAVGSPYSLASGDLPFFSMPPHETHLIDPPFISQPSNDVMNSPLTHLQYSETCQPSMTFVPKESNEMIWCPDSGQDILNYPDNITAGDNQIQSTYNMTSDGLTRHEEWPDLDLTDDTWHLQELLDNTRAELLDNTDVTEPQPEVLTFSVAIFS